MGVALAAKGGGNRKRRAGQSLMEIGGGAIVEGGWGVDFYLA